MTEKEGCSEPARHGWQKRNACYPSAIPCLPPAQQCFRRHRHSDTQTGQTQTRSVHTSTHIELGRDSGGSHSCTQNDTASLGPEAGRRDGVDN
jgi:hypothetical protein